MNRASLNALARRAGRLCGLVAFASAGWNNWGKPYAEKVARYAEFASAGPGAKPAERALWSRQLTTDEAAKYSVERVLGGADGWNPTKP